MTYDVYIAPVVVVVVVDDDDDGDYVEVSVGLMRSLHSS